MKDKDVYPKLILKLLSVSFSKSKRQKYLFILDRPQKYNPLSSNFSSIKFGQKGIED